MRFFVPYFLLCCVILDVVWLKPLQIEDSDANESDETEYEVLNGVPASNIEDSEENDVSVEDRDVTAVQEPEDDNQAESSENQYQSDTEQRYLRDIPETLSDSKRNEGSRIYHNDLNKDVQYANRRHTINYEVNNPEFRISKEELNKKTAELQARAAEDSMLFHRDEVSKNDNKYNSNGGLDTSEQAHFSKQYHNTMQTDNKRGLYDQSYKNEMLGETRERREAEQTNNLPNVSNKHLQEIGTLDEEMAIRNHIKKLSDTELKELLNSLTNEKRQLLKKIIDEPHANYDAYENINKREITKKAGALEENNLVDNVQSELSKIQPSSSSVDENTESVESTNVDSTTLNKQTGSPDTGNTNSDSKIEMSTTNDLNELKSDKLNSFTSKTDKNNEVPNIQETSKCQNKRETNYNDFLIDDISVAQTGLADNRLGNDNSPESDQEYIGSQEEEFDKNGEKQNGDYKREANLVTLDDLPDSLKSLEESFPNSNAYNNPASYSGALIRVKRKDLNHNMNKRFAGLMPHAKTGYFQYRSESEEADNDEGNEFDDEGFYDVMSNLVKNKPIDNIACDNSASQQSATDTILSDSPILLSNNNVVESINLGSDTDMVLSGVEGVDDNLMYSSRSRNRRNDHIKPNEDQKRATHSTQLVDNGVKTASEIYMSAPKYQENDAFGPLPSNSDGDLGRYKRIRRLKPAHDSN